MTEEGLSVGVEEQQARDSTGGVGADQATEYFISASSFAAPFFPDSSTHYVSAESAKEALETFAAEYKHPCGLYSADAFASADAYHKGEPRLARWLSNKAQALEAAKPRDGAYSIYSGSTDSFEINGEKYTVDDPRAGSVVRS